MNAYSRNHSEIILIPPLLQGRKLRFGGLSSGPLTPQPARSEVRSDGGHGSKQPHSVRPPLRGPIWTEGHTQQPGPIGALPGLLGSACLPAEPGKQDRCVVTGQDCGTSGCRERTHYVVEVRASMPDFCRARAHARPSLMASSLPGP